MRYASAPQGTLKIPTAWRATVNFAVVMLRSGDKNISKHGADENRADSERCEAPDDLRVIGNACGIGASATAHSSRPLRRHRSYVFWKTSSATSMIFRSEVNSHSSADDDEGWLCWKPCRYISTKRMTSSRDTGTARGRSSPSQCPGAGRRIADLYSHRSIQCEEGRLTQSWLRSNVDFGREPLGTARAAICNRDGRCSG